MSDYVKNHDWTAKDAEPSGNDNKIIKGTQFDDEFEDIVSAIASKFDSDDRGAVNGIASLDANALVPTTQLPEATTIAIGAVELATTAEVVTGTDTTRAVTAAGVEAWAAQNAGMVQDISNLADPGADRILGWDESVNAAIGFSGGAGIVFTTTVISVDHDAATNFVANEHINHANVDVIAGNGLTGGGAITADRTLTMGTPGSLTATSTNAVTSTSHTHAAGSGIVRTDPGTGGEITVSTSAASGAATNGDMWLQI